MDFTSSACYYIDDIPCFTADGVCNLEVVVCTFGGVLNILLHLLISGGAFMAGRGSQRRVRSRSILYTIFESSSLARVSCFLMLLWVLKATVGLFWKSLESSGDFSRCQCLTSNLLRRCVGKCGEYVVVKVRRSSPACGLLARVFSLSGNLIPLMLSSMVSCLYPLFFIFSTCFSLCVWNVASFEFVWRYLSSSPLMIPRPVPGGWADEACTYCWVLVGLIWVLISRMPSLANLSPLYKHRSKNMISSVENSAVKLIPRQVVESIEWNLYYARRMACSTGEGILLSR